MSVLVRNMEMPKNCASCRLWDTCEYMQDFDDWISIYEAVEDGDLVMDKNCPLVEVKTPHGDLVDRKELLAEYDRQHKGPAGGARRIMEQATAIIKAEDT